MVYDYKFDKKEAKDTKRIIKHKVEDKLTTPMQQMKKKNTSTSKT